jgi:hypothetical protein
MKRPGFAVVLFASLALLTVSTQVRSHGGGLDAQGGHHDRKNGGYHFHRRANQGSPPKPVVSVDPTATSSASKFGPSAPKGANEVAVLIALLEEKGVLEKGEFAEALRRKQVD